MIALQQAEASKPAPKKKDTTIGDIIAFIFISLIVIILFMFLIRGCKDFTNHRHHAAKDNGGQNVQIQSIRA